MQTLETAPATPQSRPLEHFLPEMQHFKNYSTHARRKNACRHIFNWIPPLALFSTWEILMHYRDPPTLFHGNVEISEAILPPCDDHSQFPDARVMRNRTVSVRELCKFVGSFDNKPLGNYWKVTPPLTWKTHAPATHQPSLKRSLSQLKIWPLLSKKLK